jgi:hypothetical protein
MSAYRWISITMFLAVPLGCVAAGESETDDSTLEEDTEQQESSLSSCVPYTGHWNFWGDCSEDVPLGAGAAVHAFRAGQVTQVYPSCGGYAGQSIRLDSGSGRTMYAHVNAAVSVGQSVQPGSYLGTVYGGGGKVYCNESLTSCGIGQTASRPTLCWSGPHLHREGPCCGTEGVLVKNQHSQRCAEIGGYSTSNGGKAVQWGCHGDTNQRWEYVGVGGGYYELRNVHSGKCLEVYGWSTSEGASVVQWQCHGGANQRWKYVDVGGGYHELRNQHSGKCLEVYGWSGSNNAPLSQWTCFGQANQRWRNED